jgi:hypothetical protein
MATVIIIENEAAREVMRRLLWTRAVRPMGRFDEELRVDFDETATRFREIQEDAAARIGTYQGLVEEMREIEHLAIGDQLPVADAPQLAEDLQDFRQGMEESIDLVLREGPERRAEMLGFYDAAGELLEQIVLAPAEAGVA